MIARLKGKLDVREPGRVLLETGGVGYEVFIPLSTFYRLPALGEVVTLDIRQVVREDAILLYGFAGYLEKSAFDLLMSVQHVGPKLALAVLSVIEPDELAVAIMRGDVERIDAVPGVGPKVAERVVRELRDKVESLRASDAKVSHDNGARNSGSIDGPGGIVDDAVSALVNLGVKPAEARRTVEGVLRTEAPADLEGIVRRSLGVLFGEK